MYKGHIINTLLDERNLKSKDLLEHLGTKATSLSQVTSGNPTVSRLEKVADFFHVSMDIFFDRKENYAPYHNNVIGNGNTVGNINSAEVSAYQIKIESLQKLIEEKDKRIELLERLLNTITEGDKK